MSAFKFPDSPFFKKKSTSSVPKGSWVGKKESIQGELERIVFHNEENHFTIARLRQNGDLITIVGNLYSVNVGETLKVTGEWESHKTFGFQFKVETFLTIVPSTVNGVKKYLGSGLVKGIGPVMAERLVAKFGAETLDVIDNNIESLGLVDGIGAKRIEMIAKAWEEHTAVRDVMVFLQTYGVSPAYAMKIFKKYGKKSVLVVKENPYRLAMDIAGIGFKMADKIAGNIGIDLKSSHRMEAGVFFALREQSDNGHVYIPYEVLMEEGKKLLNVEDDLIARALEKLHGDRQVVIEELGIREGGKAVYTLTSFVAESETASALLKLRSFRKDMDHGRGNFEAFIDGLARKMQIRYSKAQREALGKILAGEKVLVITGGPGTGKTTVIRSLVSVFAGKNRRILLAAPTGRAAKRMSESTGREARTIHRLLEYNFKKGGFTRDKESPLETDVIIIDEASMIDNYLMFHLIRAVPPEATFILIGDVDQLPSVGAGNVLKDIIGSGVVTTVFLKEIFRQKHGGLIVSNAHRINRGEFPVLPEKERGGPTGDFYFFNSENPEDSLKWIIDLCKDRIPRKFPEIDHEDIQVISPMNRGVLGTGNLNVELQAALNPEGKEIVKFGRTFRLDDRVMQVQNNYDKSVFNGDVGRITDIDLEEQEVGVRFDNARVTYSSNELDQLVLAYAVTVHKSQGSEYQAVVLPMAMEHYLLLQRNLFYTVITRAKNLVVIVGSKKAMGIAVKNDKIRRRYTWLEERLRDGGKAL